MLTACAVPLAWLVSINTLRTSTGRLMPLITAVINVAHVLLLPPFITCGSYCFNVPMSLQRSHTTVAALILVHCIMGLSKTWRHPDFKHIVVSLNRVWSAMFTILALTRARIGRLETWKMIRLVQANLAASMLAANELQAILSDDFVRSRGLYAWIASLLLLSVACTPTHCAQLRELMLTAPLSALSAEFLRRQLLKLSSTTRGDDVPKDARSLTHSCSESYESNFCTESYASTWLAFDDWANLPANTREAHL